MESHGYGASDVGRQRSNNEDALLVDDDLGLYVVCDGVGGHSAGEVASKLAVETCRATVAAHRDVLRRARAGQGEHQELRDLGRAALEAACLEVFEQATSRPELAGMGCTLTLLLVAGRRGAMAHVGDTRLYLCRDEAARQLTSDHTLAADLVRQGQLTPERMAEHPYANALTRALGSQSSVEPETLILDVLPDDTFLLCSDGLTSYLEGLGELSRMLVDSDARRLPGKLVALANERGGSDNVTAVVVQVVASPAEQDELLATAEDLKRCDDALRSVPLFEDLRFADRLRLLGIAERRSFAAGQTVLQAGEELHGLYVPVHGDLELVTPEQRTERVRPGRPVGATSLLVRRPSWATLRARDATHVLVIDAEAFARLARRRPWLGVILMTQLARVLSQELAESGRLVVESPPRDRSWWDPRRWL